MYAYTTTAQFTIVTAPEPAAVAETAQFTLTKQWSGGIRGNGSGLMLSAGNPANGAAGFVALEVVTGSVDGRAGSFALAQLGTMRGSHQRHQYEVVPGSGTGALSGLSGVMTLSVDEAGVHHIMLEYNLD